MPASAAAAAAACAALRAVLADCVCVCLLIDTSDLPSAFHESGLRWKDPSQEPLLRAKLREINPSRDLECRWAPCSGSLLLLLLLLFLLLFLLLLLLLHLLLFLKTVVRILLQQKGGSCADRMYYKLGAYRLSKPTLSESEKIEKRRLPSLMVSAVCLNGRTGS